MLEFWFFFCKTNHREAHKENKENKSDLLVGIGERDRWSAMLINKNNKKKNSASSDEKSLYANYMTIDIVLKQMQVLRKTWSEGRSNVDGWYIAICIVSSNRQRWYTVLSNSGLQLVTQLWGV